MKHDMETLAAGLSIIDQQVRQRAQDVSATEQGDYRALPDDLCYDEPFDYLFLRDYVQLSSKWSPRSPAAAHETVALHILSSAAAGRVLYRYGTKDRRAFLYHYLVAPSTLYAKTTAANIGTDLLTAAGLGRVLIGRATPSSFLQQQQETVPQDWEQLPSDVRERIQLRLENAAQRSWSAEEFGTWAVGMLRDNSTYSEFLSLLLEIYDSPEYTERSTRKHGMESLQRPALSLYALSTYADVQKIAGANTEFWKNGLLARFAIVTTAEDERHNNDPFPYGSMEFPRSLVDGLRRFDERLGRTRVEIVPQTETLQNGKEKTTRYDLRLQRYPETVVELSPEVYEAVHRYDSWLRDVISAGLPPDLSPSYGRMADRVVRIAALLAAYEDRGLCDMRDYSKAQAIVERGRLCLHWTYERLTDSATTFSQVTRTDEVLRYVATERIATARQIQQKFRKRFPSGIQELTRELDALVAAGELHCVHGTKGRRTYAVNLEDLAGETASPFVQKGGGSQ
jgi:hypothetical protein